jgi:hypothetical protein
MQVDLSGTAIVTRSLEGHKARLKAVVNQQAEQVRALYITPGDGQAMAYLMKVNEATAYKRTGVIGPHLLLEHKRTGQTVSATADLLIAVSDAWAVKSAEIEDLKLRTKAAIDAAETMEEATRAAAAFQWNKAD